MLKISIPPNELWDPIQGEFIKIKGCDLKLEHSLLSLSKWESKWCKPFLSKNGLSDEESIDYIRCMTINPVDDEVYLFIGNDIIRKVRDYIDSPMTATWFSDEKKKGSNSEQITSELIYYWMIALNIPFECEKWHLNRLLTLIQVCNIKNNPKKNMNPKEILSRNAAINAARKKQLQTKG
jgi:hypothetical protein